MHRVYIISLAVGALLANIELFAQFKPELELGSIASFAYKKSQSGDSPLVINGGSSTFLSEWDLFLGVQITEEISLYAQVQTVRGINFVNNNLSVLYQPHNNKAVNLEIGKFLIPFGTFLARRWATENPLIDWSLMYQYKNNLSAFELPQNNDELLKVRGKGHGFEYHSEPSSSALVLAKTNAGHIPRAGSGLRLVSREVYLTGLQVFGGFAAFNYNFGLTNGSLSNPADINNSETINVIGRLTFKPSMGLLLGTSFSSGAYLNQASVNPQLKPIGKSAGDFRQTASGFDLSYSIGHLVLFSEIVVNRYRSPFLDEDLDVFAYYIEAKYTLMPRLYVASRFSRMTFSEIDDVSDIDGNGKFREPWDYNVNQFELGAGYHFNRHVLLKIMGQFNHTEVSNVSDPADNHFAMQGVFYF
jgi:hypothetical protein